MGTRKRFTYHPRKTRTGYVWEYSINEEAGLPTAWCESRRSSGIEVSFGRSGKPTERSREEIVRFCIQRIDQLRTEYRESRRKQDNPTLGDIVEPYFDYDRCPHIQRLLTDGKSFTRRWAAWQRQRLDDHVLENPIADKEYAALLPGDFEEWKRELKSTGVTASVINKTITALKTAINEELHQGRVTHNPLAGVSHIENKEEDRGYFTLEELHMMFVSKAPECWAAQRKNKTKNVYLPPEFAYTLALTHFLTGERMAAILKLTWEDIDFSSELITYKRTKTSSMRVVPLPGTLIKALKVHQERSIRIGLEDYIFCYDSGEPVTYTFFRKRYDNMFERLKLPERDPDGGRRTPYSLKVSLETHLIDAGADPVHVREYMGHAHTMGNRTLTSVQARYKRRQASILRESLLPYIETLLTGIYV